MKYEDMIFIIPVESATYRDDSLFVIQQMTAILDERKRVSDNKIIINTNLKLGLPLENINKIAGPMIEAWAGEVFSGIRDNLDNEYYLINVEAQERLGMADIILQFRKNDRVLTGNVDVKATANDIPNSGKGPNITSFSRIRRSVTIRRILLSGSLAISSTASPQIIFNSLSIRFFVPLCKNHRSFCENYVNICSRAVGTFPT